MTAGSVYFARPLDSPGPVKIGFSRNPRQRLAALSASSPLKLQFAAMADSSAKGERQLHHRFASQRIHGEWFDHSDELEGVISFVQKTGRLPEWERPVRMDDAYVAKFTVTRKRGGATGEILETINKYEARALDNSLSLVELARAAKVADSTISRWRSGRKPQGVTLRKLDLALATIEAGRAA